MGTTTVGVVSGILCNPGITEAGRQQNGERMSRNCTHTETMVLGVALVSATCSSPPATMDGALTVTMDSGDYSFCSNGSFNVDQGTQVGVVAPSGTVIGTGSLGGQATTTSDLGLGRIVEIDVYKFQVAGLPSEPRYGVQVSGEQGTTWFTPPQMPHANLSLGG